MFCLCKNNISNFWGAIFLRSKKEKHPTPPSCRTARENGRSLRKASVQKYVRLAGLAGWPTMARLHQQKKTGENKVETCRLCYTYLFYI